MSAALMSDNLGDWQNQPVIQDQVLAYMAQLDCPAILREIYVPLGLPRFNVNRVLSRLHGKGVLTRYKVPVESHRPNGQTRMIVPRGATRLCYLYGFAEGYGA